MLIEGLPAGCAFYRQVHGPWSDQEHLLATVVDAIKENTYVTGVTGQVKPKPRKPVPTPRPGDKDRGRIGHRDEDMASAEDVMSYLDQFKPGSTVDAVAAQEETPTVAASLARMRRNTT